MNTPVLVAIIGALALVIVALIGRLLPDIRATRRNSAATREQVENSHSTNMRDEQDNRHQENRSRLSILEKRIGGVEKDVGRIADHLGIERTTPRRRT